MSNLSKAETWAIRELKGDKDRLVLTAGKGVAMVIMDGQDYITKSNQLLVQPGYRPIPRDPTKKIKAKLITILKRLKIMLEFCLKILTFLSRVNFVNR